MAFPPMPLLLPAALLFCLVGSYASAVPLDTGVLLKKMEAAYANVNDYRTSVEVRTFKSSGSYATEEFMYTFKKPIGTAAGLMEHEIERRLQSAVAEIEEHFPNNGYSGLLRSAPRDIIRMFNTSSPSFI